jgi:hypothetical protein
VSAWFGLAAGHDSGVGDLLPWWRDGDGAEQGRNGGVHRWWGALAILGGLGRFLQQGKAHRK